MTIPFIRKMMGIAVASAALIPGAVQAQLVPFSLSNYQITATYALPSSTVPEASAVTFNWNTGNLFIVNDEGDRIQEVTRAGTPVSSMSFTGFADTEGLTYIGNGKFVITEERLRSAYEFTYAAGGTLARSSMPVVNLGSTVGNIGIEGISFERASGDFFYVKEKTNQEVNRASIAFGSPGSATIASLFSPSLGVADLSDVQVLSDVPGLAGASNRDNLLIISQESARLIEVTRGGSVVSQFSFAGISSAAEGITIDEQGIIYVVGEAEGALGPRMFVLTPVPEPSAYLLMALGLSVVVLRVAKRRAGSVSDI